jgi:hypothetical protein
MNKKILLTILPVLLVATIALAAGPSKAAGKSDMAHLYLYEKNPADWTIVDGGAWGKLNYGTDNFVFDGHGLVAGTEYELVRVSDPWPQGITCLGTDTANNGGNVHIAGAWQAGGYKTWLVLKSDTDCATMIAWNPTSYLFEEKTI